MKFPTRILSFLVVSFVILLISPELPQARSEGSIHRDNELSPEFSRRAGSFFEELKNRARSWPMHNRDASSSRHGRWGRSINPTNVDTLAPKWEVNFGAYLPGMIPVKTPVVDSEVVCVTFYDFLTGGGASCLDKETGEVLWAKTLNQIALETIPHLNNSQLYTPLIIGSETSPLLYKDWVFLSTKTDSIDFSTG